MNDPVPTIPTPTQPTPQSPPPPVQPPIPAPIPQTPPAPTPTPTPIPQEPPTPTPLTPTPPQPIQAPPVIPMAPTPIGSPPTPSNPIIVPIIIIALILLGILLSVYFILPRFLGLTATKKGIVTTKEAVQTKIKETPSKYTTDTDSDFIPDALETELNFDPAVSEFKRCEVVPCGSTATGQAQTQKRNVLFIIDSSGSMGLLIGGKTKMDLAKEAIRGFLKSTETNVNVGIMVYGHKGSNAASAKTVSCASADIIAPIGSVSTTTVEGYLTQIKPVGWTPIGLAIKKGKDAFIGQEGQKNQIIVVTDGAETCNSDPVGAASGAKLSPYEIRVDVIGFAVNNSEQASLQAISTSGGGAFSVAINADQLLNQMRTNLENFKNTITDMKCSAAAYTTSTTCLQNVREKAFASLAKELTGKTGIEYGQISNMQTEISNRYNKKIYELQDELSAIQKANQERLK